MEADKDRKVTVLFSPANVEVDVPKGENLLRAAIEAGVHISASCGGSGACGKCKVKVIEGEYEAEDSDKLSAADREAGYILACRTRVLSDLKVEVPARMTLDRRGIVRRKAARLRTASGLDVKAHGWSFNPPIKKFFVKLPEPTLQDNVSDLTRLLRELRACCGMRDISVDFYVLKKLPKVLRQANFEVTATIVSTRVETTLDEFQLRGSRKPKLINIEPHDTTGNQYFVAIDIGTTTIWVQLVDTNTRKVIAEKADYNDQIKFGDDVITRIVYAAKSEKNLKELQSAAVGTVNRLLDEIYEETKIDIESISHFAAAGNTTMTHIFLGLDPTYVRLAPYVPVANFTPPVRAVNLGLKAPGHAHLYVFPSVAAYIGGDIVAGVLGSGFYQNADVGLYVDIGTNGEIVVGNSEWMMCASCSAGPAFEGGGIKHGMRAATGAIEDVHIDPNDYEPMTITIGQTRPKGICGSGLICLAAELFLSGLVDANGKFNRELKTPRIREGEDGMEYVLVWKEDSATGEDIVITEADLDNLIRAKAAMYAGIATLLESVGLSPADLNRVVIAGGFGGSIDLNRAVQIGLFPDIDRDKFIYIGNGPLLGARLISFSNEMIDDGERIAKMMTNIELADNAKFTEEYIGAQFLPHTNIKLFPSVQRDLEERRKDKAVA